MAVATKKAERLTPDARRQQIVAATIACLARRGPEGWTLRQVARDLDIAPSLVTYFFARWGDLVVAAYRSLAERFEADFANLPAGPEPEARLRVWIDRYFAEDWVSDEISGAYVAFWALTRQEPALRAEMDRFGATMRGALRPVVAGYVGRAEASEGVVETLYFLLSGLWYEMAVNPGSLTPTQAKARAWAYLETVG
ncbi:MAG: TetR family transcriptional regulator C-terminal domain-containing protein [Pseudomonadota bacterium]